MSCLVDVSRTTLIHSASPCASTWRRTGCTERLLRRWRLSACASCSPRLRLRLPSAQKRVLVGIRKGQVLMQRWRNDDFLPIFTPQPASACGGLSNGRDFHRILRFDRFALDSTRGCLRSGDRDIELRPKAFEVLLHLVENAGRLVGKENSKGQSGATSLYPTILWCSAFGSSVAHLVTTIIF